MVMWETDVERFRYLGHRIVLCRNVYDRCSYRVDDLPEREVQFRFEDEKNYQGQRLRALDEAQNIVHAIFWLAHEPSSRMSF
jgi:hypothetical protein